VSEAERWDERYREAPLSWPAEPNEFVEEELAGLEPGTAVDLACGEGRNAVWLAERGWQVTGVDFSSVAIDRARRMAAERGVDVEWIHADILEWEPARTFDLVLIVYIHLPPKKRDRLMRNAVGWVAPGGRFFLVGHDAATAGVSGPPDPEILWTPEIAVESTSPLEVVVAERRYRDTENGRAADTVLLAHRPEE